MPACLTGPYRGYSPVKEIAFLPPHIAYWHARRHRTCRLSVALSVLMTCAMSGIAGILATESASTGMAIAALMAVVAVPCLGKLAQHLALRWFDRRVPYPEAPC
jgi:hypothetical protein